MELAQVVQTGVIFVSVPTSKVEFSGILPTSITLPVSLWSL